MLQCPTYLGTAPNYIYLLILLLGLSRARAMGGGTELDRARVSASRVPDLQTSRAATGVWSERRRLRRAPARSRCTMSSDASR